MKMHDAGYEALGIHFKYVAFGSPSVEPIVKAMRILGVRGLGVSMPHKVAVIKHLDEVTKDVEAIGACNTVVNDDGRLVGHNTDWQGVRRAIQEGGLADCQSALIVGGGGVARAIAYALKQDGVHVTVATRGPDQARRLVDDLGLDGAVPFEEQTKSRAELRINATPDSSAVQIDAESGVRGVLDVVYHARSTSLTDNAERLGIPSVSGWRMLLHQGAAQFELYTGETAPLLAMGTVLEAALPPR
jgi:shikimate dehydrogenase